MLKVKSLIKKIVPENILSPYYYLKALFWATYFKFPARKMIIVGVTGTKGKTSTTNYIWSLVQSGGYKAGIITTANFRIGNEESVNPYHMTMPSARIVQEKLSQMEKAGVKVAIVEMTSEGMKQYRHLGIPVDIGVFTNLTPEHLGSHKNDFSEYKKAKSAMFKSLVKSPKVNILPFIVNSTIIANSDSEHSKYYLDFKAKNKITYGIKSGEYRATQIIEEISGTRFVLNGEKMSLRIPGIFNVYNALPAIIIGKILKIDSAKIAEGLHGLEVIPGRMEAIDCGQPFLVFVDYAHEPASLSALLESAKNIKNPSGRILLLIGVIGGGRASRVPLLEVACTGADIIMITNEDPYDDDPGYMIEKLKDHAVLLGKKYGEDILTNIDRKIAIDTLLSIARENDIVLISGKGAETTMMTASGQVPFDERAIVRQLTKKYSSI